MIIYLIVFISKKKKKKKKKKIKVQIYNKNQIISRMFYYEKKNHTFITKV